MIHAFFHSYLTLSYDQSITASEVSSVQSAIQCFLFQFSVFSLYFEVVQYLFFLLFP